MYIRTYDQYPSSSPELTLTKKHQYENLAKTTRQGQHLKNIILRTSLSKYPKSPVKHTQQNQQIKLESHFYESGHAGSYLKNNRIREVKTKYRAKQRAKQKTKQQLLELLERAETNRICSYAPSPHQSPEKKNFHKTQFSISGAQVSPEDKFHINKICSADKIYVKQLKPAVLDLTKLYKRSKHKSKSSIPKCTDCVSEIHYSSRKLKQTEQIQPLRIIHYRRSMTSHRRRTNFNEDKQKLINTQRSALTEKEVKAIENINPWAVKKLQEDQQLMF